MPKINTIKIDTDPAKKSVKDLRNELKQLKDEIVNLEKGTNEYSKAILEAAEILHQLKEMTEEINASAMDAGQILGNATKAVQGLVGAITAVTGAMTLFGASDEDAQKVVKTLTSLIAIIQGLSAIDAGIKAFKRLGLAIKSSAVFMALFNKEGKIAQALSKANAAAQLMLSNAFKALGLSTNGASLAMKGLRTAIISTGIGALIVAVGALIANFDKIKSLFGSTQETAGNMKEALTSYNAALSQITNNYNILSGQSKRVLEDRTKALKNELNLLKARNASDAEIYNKEKEILETRLAALGTATSENGIIRDTVNYINSLKNNVSSIYGISANDLATLDKTEQKIKNINLVILEQQAHLAAVLSKSGAYTGISDKEQERWIKQFEGDIEKYKQQLAAVLMVRDAQMNLWEIQNDRLLTENELAVLEATRAQNNKKFTATELEYAIKQKQIADETYKYSIEEYKDMMDLYDKQLLYAKKGSEEILKIEYNRAKYIKDFSDATGNAYDKTATDAIAAYEKYAQLLKEEEQRKQDLYSLDQKSIASYYADEETALELSLNNREIGYEEYYNRLYDLQKNNIDQQRLIIQQSEQSQLESLDKQKEALTSAYNIALENGLDDATTTKLLKSIQDLEDEKVKIVYEANEQIASLNREALNIEADHHQNIVQLFADKIQSITDSTLESISMIVEATDGLSSKWGDAISYMMQGLNNLAIACKEGGAGWQDYSQLAVASLYAASQMMMALADQQDAENREGFEKQKKLQIASATMSMFAGIAAAVSGLFTTKSGPWDIALAAIQASMIAALGAVQIANIKKQKFNGGGSGSASLNTGAMGNIIAPVQYTKDVQGASIEDTIGNSRVYVTENDITSTQRRVAVSESEATF